MKRPRSLLVCAMIAGWLGVTGGSRAEEDKVLRVALAGTMEQVISRQIGPAFTAATGYTLDVTRQSSVLLANRIASGELTPDVYISSDANVMELVMGPANNDRARWYLPILRSRTVIMHGTQSRFNNDIGAVRAGKLPWYELMQRPGLVPRRPNPAVDSGGYRAIFVFDLAERLYKLPGLKQRVLGNDNNESQYFDRSKDFPLIRDGSIDGFVTYTRIHWSRECRFSIFPRRSIRATRRCRLVCNRELHQSAWTDIPRHLRRLCRNDTGGGAEPDCSRGFRPLASVRKGDDALRASRLLSLQRVAHCGRRICGPAGSPIVDKSAVQP